MANKMTPAERYEYYKRLAQDPKFRSFLDFTARMEGTEKGSGNLGYDTLVGYGNRISDFSTHPNAKKVIPIYNSKTGKKENVPTTAAGRYQFTNRTWRNVNKTFGGKLSFSPIDQDIAALALADSVGLLKPWASGNVSQVLQKGQGTWASFGPQHGQPYRKPEAVKKILTTLNTVSPFDYQVSSKQGQQVAGGFSPKVIEGTPPNTTNPILEQLKAQMAKNGTLPAGMLTAPSTPAGQMVQPTPPTPSETAMAQLTASITAPPVGQPYTVQDTNAPSWGSELPFQTREWSDTATIKPQVLPELDRVISQNQLDQQRDMQLESMFGNTHASRVPLPDTVSKFIDSLLES